MDNEWAVIACMQFSNGELLDKKKPFATYYVKANNAKQAIAKLKKQFDCCEVTICGEPVKT